MRGEKRYHPGRRRWSKGSQGGDGISFLSERYTYLRNDFDHSRTGLTLNHELLLLLIGTLVGDELQGVGEEEGREVTRPVRGMRGANAHILDLCRQISP